MNKLIFSKILVMIFFNSFSCIQSQSYTISFKTEVVNNFKEAQFKILLEDDLLVDKVCEKTIYFSSKSF